MRLSRELRAWLCSDRMLEELMSAISVFIVSGLLCFGLVLNDFVTALESSSATLTVALYVYASERGETGVAFAIAVILMTLTLLLNFAANMAAKKLKNV